MARRCALARAPLPARQCARPREEATVASKKPAPEKKRKHPGGRPSKLTARGQRRVCAAIAKGAYLENACAAAGVGYSTFRTWMTTDSPRHREFQEAVTRAEAQAELAVVAQWRAQCPKDW